MASRTSSRRSETAPSPELSRRDTRTTQATTKDKKSAVQWIKTIWQKSGLDQPTILLMLK